MRRPRRANQCPANAIGIICKNPSGMANAHGIKAAGNATNAMSTL